MPAVTILNSNLPAAVIDAFVSLDWTRPYWKAGKFALKVSPAVTGVSEIVKGRILLPPDSQICYVIEDILREDEGTSGGEVLTITGRDLGGFFAERVALPTAGLAYDTQTSVAAETAMKHLVNVNAGPGASSGRQIPSMTVAANAARGGIVTVNARYQYVSDLIEQIGMTGGIGWQVLYNGTGFVFDVIPGVDRHASVYFDALFDTAQAQSWYTSDSGTKTFAYVAGQGDGASRAVVTRPASSIPTGLALRETFIDARDLPDTASLQTRGDSELAASVVADRFEVTVNPLGSFKYRTDWDLGDLVTIRNEWWNVSRTCRIVDVSLSLDADSTTPGVTISLDRAFPTLADAVSQAAGSGVSTADAVFSATNNPAIVVTKTAAQTFTFAGFSQIIFDTVGTDITSSYSASTGLFTAPVAGWYLATVAFSTSTTGSVYRFIISLFVNGAEAQRLDDNEVPVSTRIGLFGTALVHMNAGDTAGIEGETVPTGNSSRADVTQPNLNIWSMRRIG